MFNIVESTQEDVIAAGEKALVCLYNGKPGDNLDALRYKRNCEKVATSNSLVKPQSLPPTSAAAKFYSLWVFFQIHEWKGLLDDTLHADQWGWNATPVHLPVMTDLAPAPDNLLKIIRCTCQTDCSSLRCTCRKHNLLCFSVLVQRNCMHKFYSAR